MTNVDRSAREIVVDFANGATDSNTVDMRGGAFGTVIVPTGSALIGKTLQFVAVSQFAAPRFAATALLTTPITLAAGANTLSIDQIRECGAASVCLLRVNSAVGADAQCVLLWKS